MKSIQMKTADNQKICLTGAFAQKAFWPAVLVFVIFCAIILFLFDPLKYRFYPPCIFHAATGLYCAGCGSLRGLHQLLTGHPLKALGFNPLMVLTAVIMAYSFITAIIRRFTGRAMPFNNIPALWTWIFFGAVLLFWFLRNLPFYPFSMLAP
ncbi:MAG: DUF2752 domain-containing protein [Planctomycetes bacterium]|nr:DUF2752 domain-containing protein [Planctomycetota bacterium]